ncbi:hypothetical protein GQR58_018676 [Nymphon striatum]|nr:hypothetical protein GQR58_018676 [Nymphon striatum]
MVASGIQQQNISTSVEFILSREDQEEMIQTILIMFQADIFFTRQVLLRKRGKCVAINQQGSEQRNESMMRIHIERIIGLIKNIYTILEGPLKIQMVKSLSEEASASDVSGIDKLFTTCCILVNLGDDIVYNEIK